MADLGALLLPAVPLLALLACLLLGHSPGAEAVVRLSERIAAAARHRGRPARSPLPRPRAHPSTGAIDEPQNLSASIEGVFEAEL